MKNIILVITIVLFGISFVSAELKTGFDSTEGLSVTLTKPVTINYSLVNVNYSSDSDKLDGQHGSYYTGYCDTALGDYVPYTGASSNVDLNRKYIINVSMIVNSPFSGFNSFKISNNTLGSTDAFVFDFKDRVFSAVGPAFPSPPIAYDLGTSQDMWNRTYSKYYCNSTVCKDLSLWGGSFTDTWALNYTNYYNKTQVWNTTQTWNSTQILNGTLLQNASNIDVKNITMRNGANKVDMYIDASGNFIIQT